MPSSICGPRGRACSRFGRRGLLQSGELNARALMPALVALGKEVLAEDLLNLLREADVDGSGAITFDDFERLLTLLEQFEPPPQHPPRRPMRAEADEG